MAFVPWVVASSNPGLELANAFGVSASAALKLINAFGVRANAELKLINAFGKAPNQATTRGWVVSHATHSYGTDLMSHGENTFLLAAKTPKALANSSPGLAQPWGSNNNKPRNAESVGEDISRISERLRRRLQRRS